MNIDANLIQRIALFLPAILVSLTVHEYAHAWVATKLGDDTPTRQGRLTFSPLAHIDLFGTVIFPLMLLATTGGFFGWAKPVQFNPHNFTRRFSMRQGAALTAVAGPASNILLALIALIAMRVLIEMGVMGGASEDTSSIVFKFISALVPLNVLLAVFNILPLPPLDGSYLLPRSMDQLRAWLERYSMIIFLLVFLLPIPGLGSTLGGYIIRPLMVLTSTLLTSIVFWGL